MIRAAMVLGASRQSQAAKCLQYALCDVPKCPVAHAVGCGGLRLGDQGGGDVVIGVVGA
jgi:hypothetical protein